MKIVGNRFAVDLKSTRDFTWHNSSQGTINNFTCKIVDSQRVDRDFGKFSVMSGVPSVSAGGILACGMLAELPKPTRSISTLYQVSGVFNGGQVQDEALPFFFISGTETETVDSGANVTLRLGTTRILPTTSDGRSCDAQVLVGAEDVDTQIKHIVIGLGIVARESIDSGRDVGAVMSFNRVVRQISENDPRIS